MKKRMYIAIDLKSFYASVECVERGLDPFTTNLVVADPTRSKSTICLAITPAMKKLGVKNRCRIHEIPANIEYITAMPRMQLYIDYSSNIYSIYLKHVSPDDIHVYSIDECFIDVTEYLALYHQDAKEMAITLMNDVMEETGICATAGIGTNLYLCKIAMDIVAKHVPDHIGYLDEESFKLQLWDHRPLTDFWRIGSGTASRLARYGMYTMGDIARTSLHDEAWLYKQFGIDAELLIDHAWGIEPCTIQDIKSYKPETNSLSSGQVLMRNYTFEEARVIVREMTDLLVLDLVAKKLVSESFTLYISYDHKFEVPGSNGSINLGSSTNSARRIVPAVIDLYNSITHKHIGIRRINICCNKVKTEGYYQLDLFSDLETDEKERNIQQAMLAIRKRYGTNAIMKGSNLLDCSTFRERNGQIGGHKA
ncbi:MAG: DNA repair protein [Anaerostipes sp.]|uniref:DNA polymerase V n=1 Tax=Hespellia stercorisuis DSM 15480 TaxID=1121950 RepID=A0A1M6VMK0_9FIRM|nr:DNA repair protein [Hespellia stercorisuis]MDD3186294.1 DNA repair protein [Anaerostipes sp.]MDD3746304.1 DNA repair protein [Anaerostipes sp.]SHK82787.1 DNA polymerase V [Hespellia stercorisuis DSM 15480]